MKESIKIEGIEYVPKTTTQQRDENIKESIKVEGTEHVPKTIIQQFLDYVIIRTYSAGVHAGYLKNRDGKRVDLIYSRRIWYWSGACSLSQLAKDGTKDPDNCKFSTEIEKITLTECIEVIPCTEKAIESIQHVKEWKK